jgi:hypothetical protein
MPYVPGFDYDIFISYAAGDNDQGGVEQFIATLEKQISDNLVNAFSKEKVRVYFDRQRLATHAGVNWEEQLKAAASSSAILVPLLSPNYLSSLYCSKERGWFGTQSHVSQGCPYAVTGWVPIGQHPQPKEFEKAQRHPAGDSWLALAPPEERLWSCREFALKLRDALVEMRASVSAVFLGPAVEGRGAATRSRLMDELEKSGYRVVPGPDFVYEDPEAVRAYLKSSLLAIHFPGDGLDLEGLTAIEESFLSARKTLLVQPMGSTLSDDEAALLEEIDAQLVSGGRFAGVAYSKFAGKTDDQIWEVVRREVRTARFQKNKSEFAVGIACEEGDLSGAKALAELIGELGIPARYPSFDIAASITEKLQALRVTITQSQALICYWAAAAGKGLEKRLAQDARRQYKAKAWYLGPPLDVPAKTNLTQTNELVLRQAADTADLATLEPFLRELGWERTA